MDTIVLIHNGGPSMRLLAVKLREAEEDGDMEAYRALLRLPVQELVFIHAERDPFAMVFECIERAPPREDEKRFFLARPQHYRDLEFKSRGRRAQVLRHRTRQ
jgi:hypothetical protein